MCARERKRDKGEFKRSISMLKSTCAHDFSWLQQNHTENKIKQHLSEQMPWNSIKTMRTEKGRNGSGTKQMTHAKTVRSSLVTMNRNEVELHRKKR